MRAVAQLMLHILRQLALGRCARALAAIHTCSPSYSACDLCALSERDCALRSFTALLPLVPHVCLPPLVAQRATVWRLLLLGATVYALCRRR